MQTTTCLTACPIEELSQSIEGSLIGEVPLSQRQQILVGSLIAHRVEVRELLGIDTKGLSQTISFQGLEHVLIGAE